MLRGFSRGSGFIWIYPTNWYVDLRNISVDPSIYMKSKSYGECDHHVLKIVHRMY